MDPGEEPMQVQRQPSAFDIRKVQGQGRPTGMSQRSIRPQTGMQSPAMGQPPLSAYAPQQSPAPKSPLATAPNSPQRIGQDIDVRAGGMEEDDGYS